MNILMVIALTVVPLKTFIQIERTNQYVKRTVAYDLHDKLQEVLYVDRLKKKSISFINNVEIKMTFDEYEKDYIRGCASWENLKGKQDKICLYGFKTE